MEIRETLGAAVLAGLFAAGVALTAADAAPAQLEVDGVTVTALASEDYMPGEP